MINQNLLLTGDDGYNLTNSLRFRSSASAYLNRTFSTPTNNKIWTWSGWSKRGVLGSRQFLSSTNTTGGTNAFYFEYASNDVINIGDYTSSWTWQLTTTQVFRDPSAWYHIILVVDTTQATASNRVKLYVNGVQVTAFSTASYPTQNANTYWNSAVYSNIGNINGASLYLDGYLAEVNFIDGQALTPSSFGSTSAFTGVWQPIRYTGTYGTNGFYLPFTDTTSTSTLGTDFSGNSNTWTVNNISLTAGTTYDSMTDLPTLTSATAANYCVLNPLDTGNTPTNGNLTYPAPSAAWKVNRATFSIPETAKAYWEIKISGDSTNNISCGVDTGLSSLTAQLGSTSAGWAIVPPNSTGSTSANKYNNGSSTSVTLPSNSGTNDVYMFAVDRNTNSIWVGINGSFVGTVGTSGQIFNNLPSTGTLFPAICTYNKLIDVNFGQQPFSYTPPIGFNRLNTFNLTTPTIGATAATTANKYFDATTYTGTGSTQNITNSGSMQPDFVWIKNRSSTNSHQLTDSVRGVNLALASDLTIAEFTGNINAFNANGFQLTGATNAVNASGQTYVGWQWRASGSTTNITVGQYSTSPNVPSIASTVSANTSAGFSVVTYTGNGTAGATWGHGLGVAPSMVIVKARSLAGENWIVYHTSLGNAQQLNLNTTSAQSASTNFNSTSPTSSVFSIGSGTAVNSNTNTYVAYCFAQVAGYSAFGSYTGNNSNDGPFVYTGFRPRFVIIKDTISAGFWTMYDTSRSTFNVSNSYLQAQSSAAEDSVYPQIDFLSNGFKLRAANSTSGQNNVSGNTYIYMAFAEVPFKYSLGR